MTRRNKNYDPFPAAYARLSVADQQEIAQFQKFRRLVGEAERAGCSRVEAMAAIYPDIYPSDDDFGTI